MLVAVVDSGVDTDHPQLSRPGKVPAGQDFDLVGDLPGNFDCVSHGTAVASVIAADPVDGVGFAGLAPGARVLPVRVTERDVAEGGGSAAFDPVVLARGIWYAAEQGADIVAAARAGGHDVRSGTSFVAPFVSATAALVRARWPELTAPQVVARLLATAGPAPGGVGDAYGAGLVDPYRAVTEGLAVGPPAPLPEVVVPPEDPARVAAAAWWARLGISVRTMRRVVSDLMDRLGARSRFQAGAKAADRGRLVDRAG
ncbi:S8 family serine peptidase [Saccharothrix sp. Mg75]|uniref:S8 family serine peptidase n=1 Tax=Saccharothrix sp. Mg75 TaxID=3445357 RepID=UPI003EEC5DBB